MSTPFIAFCNYNPNTIANSSMTSNDFIQIIFTQLKDIWAQHIFVSNIGLSK
jgi:hypothetical protein